MSDVVVRLARPDELDEVGRLTAAAYVDDGLIEADDAYVSRLADAADRAEQAELWVAELDDAIVGTVTFCPPGSAYREPGGETEGEFRMLAVSRHARGHGVGRALVRHCVERSRDFDFERIVLSTMDEMVSARRLYTSMGFERDPSRDWSPVPGVTLIVYVIDVPRGASR